MQNVMLTLGTVSDGFKFSISTAAYQELNRSNSWKWEEQSRAGEYPNLQYTGKQSETVALRGVVYPTFRGGLGQLDAMRRKADEGKPMLLTDGRGKVWGDYVITSISEGQRVFFPDGTPKKQEFTLNLKKYVD